MNASLNFSLLCFLFCLNLFSISLVIFQIDADYKLQDMKKLYKELEMKGRGYKKKLDDLQVALVKHMEQYALFYETIRYLVTFVNKNFNILIFFFCLGYRIQKDLVDPEKLQATLGDETLTENCGLKRALEMVALIEAQLKEMNPNLDSISEYAFSVLSTYDVS